jgi:site-specific recombinase XerD
MSTQSASRVNPNPIKTLADVVDAVRAADLPKQRGQELASALRTAARAIGKPLDRVPADPRRLAALMSEVSPIALNISLERWANVRSLTRAGLALVQPMAPGRLITPLSPGWKALWKQLPSKVKMALSRFARFSTVRGIEPEGVTAETFEAFRAYLDDSLLKSPDRIYGAMARGWRAAQTAVESWPRIGITVPNRRKDWTLPWSRFPASLEQDCAAWCDRLAGRDLLADGPVRIVRPGTVAHRERQIRTFASALVRQGRDPATLVSLKDLVEIEALKTGLMFLIERSGGKTTTAIYDFVSAMKAVARHHLHVEQDHLDQIARIMRRLDVGHRGLSQKNRSRLRQLDDPQNVTALLDLPRTLIDLAARNPRPYAGALQAQTAVAIEILLMAPLRIDNLACLDLDRNLVRPGRSNIIHIVFEREDVKNREPLEYPLPPEGVALIGRYLSAFRERFAPPSCCTALFPGRSGGSKSLNALRDQICKAVHRYTGMRMHPHLFRHAGAKLYLDANPGSYEVVRRVLAHRSISTTTNFYTGLESASAVRHFDATILKRRNSGKAA